MNKTATIFDIQRGSTVDGPGIRTTVFFKGCNLRCEWCHNPESQRREHQMMIYKNRCNGCGKCRKVCSNSLKSCNLCGKCVDYCPNDARRICGREYTVDEVFSEIIKDKAYYGNSDGGVTFSGGECMLQIDFLVEILKLCKENGIHTAVDTAGNVDWHSFERVIPYTDVFLYDVKCYCDDLHKRVTGVSNKLIFDNLNKLSEVSEIIIRIPIIPGINNDIDELKGMASLIKPLNVSKIELLPYHRLGENKYLALDKELKVFDVPTEEEIKKHRELFL